MGPLPKLVILGRDGVINERREGGVETAEDWVPIEGSLEAIARLNHAGVLVALASNQPGIGDGRLPVHELNRIHGRLQQALARVGGHVDGIFFCPHSADAGCSCRKPAPGLLRSAALRLSVALDRVPVIGDSACDVGAAQAARARPCLVRTGRGERTLAESPDLGSACRVFADLGEAVEQILAVRPVP